MSALICKKCGKEVTPMTHAKNSETGEELKLPLKRLPFGLCQECFIETYKDDPDMINEKLPQEIAAIAVEALAEALGEKVGADQKVFDYTCPQCGKKAKGVADKAGMEKIKEKAPLCPECGERKEHAGEEQSFAA